MHDEEELEHLQLNQFFFFSLNDLRRPKTTAFKSPVSLFLLLISVSFLLTVTKGFQIVQFNGIFHAWTKMK